MGSRLTGMMAEDGAERDEPWLDHPDGKWSPRPSVPLDCAVDYEVSCGQQEEKRKRSKSGEDMLEDIHLLVGTKFQRSYTPGGSCVLAPTEREQPSRVVLMLPVLGDIIGFLHEPEDMINMCRVSQSISETNESIIAHHWENMYQQRWPAFYTAHSYTTQCSAREVNWQAIYSHTLKGKYEQILEVFDREKKLGFAMSCMVAKVKYEAGTNSYVAHYISASHVLPERIPYCEGHRIRFCPVSARQQLKPETVPPQASDIYPYRILLGVEDLKVGQGVELQWKMQMGSPFGWWYGTVESIERSADNQGPVEVTMIFTHFPATSRWHRLHVTVGDGIMRRCAIGGHHGGIRGVSAEEEKQWRQFFPKHPVVF